MTRWIALAMIAGVTAACGPGNAGDEVARGMQVFAEHCISCHSNSEGVIIVGPSLYGVATRAEENAAGIEPREYLRTSIISPRAEITEGFRDLMPSDFEQKLTSADLEALLSYLLTL